MICVCISVPSVQQEIRFKSQACVDKQKNMLSMIKSFETMSMSYTYNETQIWSPRFHPLLPSRSVGGTFRLNLHKMEPWRHWNDFCVHMRISAFSHVHVLKHFKSDPFYCLIMKYGFGRFDCFKLINVRI